jgi:hypothetical protein
MVDTSNHVQTRKPKTDDKNKKRETMDEYSQQINKLCRLLMGIYFFNEFRVRGRILARGLQWRGYRAVPENELLPQMSSVAYDFWIVPTLRPRWHCSVVVGCSCAGTTIPQGCKVGNGGSSTQHFHCQYLKMKLKTKGKLTPFIPLGKVSLLGKSEKEIAPKGLF